MLHPAHSRDGLALSVRLADAITSFAGNMRFIYLHVAWFAVWMLVVEKSPWPTLTLIVSLEAIFLSTFVMIGQNRTSQIDREQASHDYSVNQESLAIQHAIHGHLHGEDCDCWKGVTL